jgi:DNA-binding transcriptional LysR family regulator
MQIHNRQALIERLARNEDDLYIFANPPADQEVVCQPILDNPLVVFARADHPLAGQRGLPIESLIDEPFLMREVGSGTRMVAWEVFDRAGFEPNVRMELSTNEAVRQAILAGLGISILSRYTLGLDTENPHLAVLDIRGFPIERPWQFVYPVGKQLSPSARAFMDMVRIEAKHLVQEHLGHEAKLSAPNIGRS